MNTTRNQFFENPETVLYALAKLFASEGSATVVAILTYSKPELMETHYDNLDGGTTFYTLLLHIPLNLYSPLQDNRESIEKSICDKAQIFLEHFSHNVLAQIKILPELSENPKWRETAAAWLAGKVNNQGRVRSDNLAPLSKDGLLFRSQPEIYLYLALKESGVSFAPLPVFVRGGKTYRRIEPDFFIIHQGIAMVIEVDGDTVHQETPADAHDRTTMLQHEGVKIERISASKFDTPEKAKTTAQDIMITIKKYAGMNSV